MINSMRLSFLSIAFLLAFVPIAGAEGTARVANTVHNLSTTAPVDLIWGFALYASNEDEICVFCHTPHGGSLTGPLWNHSLSTASYTHYTSATLSTFGGLANTTRAVNNESMLCLSCHDGSVSVYTMLNKSNSGPAVIYNANTFDTDTRVAYMGTSGAQIAPVTLGVGDLSNDHPISFSYDSVITNEPYTTSKAGELRDPSLARDYLGEGVEFFGPTNRVECSSCHDPHVDYNAQPQYAPFLRRPNTGSALCFACHIK